MAPMGFLVDVQPFAFAEERRYFLAEQGGRLVAFLAAVPVYAPRGVVPRRTCSAIPLPRTGPPSWSSTPPCARSRPRGAATPRSASAPLARHGWMRVVREWTRALYDFEGVRAFKAKLRPHAWEPIYLAYAEGASPNAALFDALAAFARGSFARFGAETLLHGPAVVVRALAALLVPWTALLALAPGGAGFRSRGRGGRGSGSTWRSRSPCSRSRSVAIVVARSLAIAITVDAVTTWGEGARLERAAGRGGARWVVLGVACGAGRNRR